MRAIDNDLLLSALGRYPRMILTVPPRHGKSEETSRYHPAWLLGCDPYLRVGVISYAAEFAASWGRKARDIMAEYGPELFGVRVRSDVAARDQWELEATPDNGVTWIKTGGSMVTAGIGGPLTGKGLDVAIIDDPIKNAEEAFSSVNREKQWEWFQSTLMTRLEPGGRVILIMTRWHEDDLVGRIVEAMGDTGEQWHLINYPALAEANDPLGRAEGEALWPERYPVEVLEAVRMNRGDYWFSAMYQQRPVPLGKQTIPVQHLRYYTEEGNNFLLIEPTGERRRVPKDALTKFTTVDLATSEKQTADFTVASTWGNTWDNDTLLLDVTRERFGGTEHLPLLRSVWVMWQPGFFYVEATAFQLSLIQQAVGAGLPVLPSYPDKDKVARSLSFSARVKAGKYYFPLNAPWLQDCLKEMNRFPAWDHDDFVDTCSLSALVTAGGGYVGNL